MKNKGRKLIAPFNQEGFAPIFNHKHCQDQGERDQVNHNLSKIGIQSALLNEECLQNMKIPRICCREYLLPNQSSAAVYRLALRCLFRMLRSSILLLHQRYRMVKSPGKIRDDPTKHWCL